MTGLFFDGFEEILSILRSLPSVDLPIESMEAILGL
jgi:hypothetical protein